MKKTYLALLLPLLIVGCNTTDSDDNTANNGNANNQVAVIQSADGWAAANGVVTGGEGASESHIYTVTTRDELIEALYGDANASLSDLPSNEPKIIYISGTIDLTADASGASRSEESFMAECDTTFDDYDTFYTAYQNEYDPNVWNNQTLENGDPPDPYGELEEQRDCFQHAQADYIKFRVGSNTSIIGLGDDAEIKFGTLSLGQSGGEAVQNIIIRNIAFNDAFDMFPAWDPGDSFSIDDDELGVGNCSAEYISDEQNPNACPSREGGGRWNSEYDLISVDNAQQVWIDHNYFSDGERTDDQYPPVFDAPYNAKEQKVQHHDGLIDVTNGATQVTITYNVFENHDKTNLLGGSDNTNANRNYGPGSIDVTFHHNYWHNTGQRMPRVRFGRVHVYNNYYSLNNSDVHAEPYYPMGEAVILGAAAKIFAENNVFEIATEDTESASAKIVSYKSKQSKKERCLEYGFTEQECSTYFYSSGNTLDGNNIDLTPIAQEHAESSSSNAELYIIDPEATDNYWTPQMVYDYQLQSTSSVKQFVIDNAGTGKIDIQ